MKAHPKNPFVLSDGLKMLKRRFEQHSNGCSLNADGVAMITGEIEQLFQLAREAEVSAMCWRAQGNAIDMAITAAAVKAAATGNVLLFEPAFRAAFSDGGAKQRRGAAVDPDGDPMGAA